MEALNGRGEEGHRRKKVKGLVKTGPMANLRLEEVLQEDAGVPMCSNWLCFFLVFLRKIV